jgi:hypothetical protein
MKKLILSLVLSSMTLALSAAEKPASADCCSKTDVKQATCKMSGKSAQCAAKQQSGKQALLSPKAAAEATRRS